jgi:uncharacterized protein (DUF58 family)
MSDDLRKPPVTGPALPASEPRQPAAPPPFTPQGLPAVPAPSSPQGLPAVPSVSLPSIPIHLLPPIPSSFVPLPRLPPLPPLPLKSSRRNTPKVSILSPAELERFGNLLMFARSTVEGYFAGKHKSPYHGSSVEFADYKEYVPGDDIKHLDWRAYGRLRRLYLRQFEAETDMVIYLLVDVSASMNYTGTSPSSKYVLAAKIAAAFAYLMIQQSDKAALVLFAEKIRHFLPPGGTRGHLHNLVFQLETATPASTTGIADALMAANSLFKKRGRLVVLSDFWDDTDKTFQALSQFLHRKFEILLLQIVNPHELDLHRVHAARFHDMETHESVEVEPEEIREAYRMAARQWVDKVAREADNRGIRHAVVPSDRPYLDAIEAYLGFRGRNTLSTR